MIAIVFGAIASNSMNYYTGSLALPGARRPVRRPSRRAVAILRVRGHLVDERWRPSASSERCCCSSAMYAPFLRS